MGLKIIKSGFRTLLQDQGRFGYHSIGLGISGAADELSYFVGQYLLGGSAKNALEIFLGNFEAEFQKDTNFSITGAEAEVTQNGKQIPMWSRFFAKKGDVIKIGAVKAGSFNYLSVDGGFEVEKFCGSYATNFKLAVGANQGQRLNKQTLCYKENSKRRSVLFQKKHLPIHWRESSLAVFEMRLVVFPNAKEFFHSEDLQKFFQNTFCIGLDSDRVGIRLEGQKMRLKKNQIQSEPLSFGTIQVQNSGIPIVLMKDCQTIGGYPKIGYLCALDSFWLAQLRSKQKIRFVMETSEKSQASTKGFYRKFAACLSKYFV
jgi:biotin-dependent carboxylase-like uncharacterized protein